MVVYNPPAPAPPPPPRNYIFSLSANSSTPPWLFIPAERPDGGEKKIQI